MSCSLGGIRSLVWFEVRDEGQTFAVDNERCGTYEFDHRGIHSFSKEVQEIAAQMRLYQDEIQVSYSDVI